MAPSLLMREVARIPSGPHGSDQGRVVCCDSDHDSLPELLFSTGTINHSWDPLRIEVWEHQGWNRFRLAYSDTADSDCFRYPWWPSHIEFGAASPMAAGDIDGDGLTDLLCVTCHYDTTGGDDTLFSDVITVESPNRFSYPCSLTWHCPYMRNQAPTATPAYFPPDLNGDGRGEILLGGMMWENVGNDSNELVCCGAPSGMCGYAFGDFCREGKIDLVNAGTEGALSADVWESSGADSFERIWQDTLLRGQAVDIFSTADIDGNGRPEFYLNEYRYTEARIWLVMYQAESDGGHQFTRTLVDSLTFWGDPDAHSAGGDIDGDGVDECVWTTPDSIRVYKAFGDNDLRDVWEWQNDHGVDALMTTVYDVNSDGYNELIAYSNDKISIFEVDAVDLLSPNGGTYNVGDTVPIRWATHTPPRCDSLSLFLRRDSLWNLQTIATGLPGTDTLYRWVVPSGVPDTGRIVVMAYGPGHQYDMSDSVITFIGGGVAEGTHNVPLQWSLTVSPNPARGPFSVRYDVPNQSHLSVGIYDADGRLVRSLRQGNVTPGRYEAKLSSDALPAGIYFLRLDTPGFRSVKKAVVAR